MRLTFCGVRGSTPAPGPEYTCYGGNTSCVAVSRSGEAPSLVVDGGTGLTRVTKLCGDLAFQGTILLSHLHWDHTHGLPFFSAGARDGHRVDLVLPAPEDDPLELLARAFSPPHFPVRPEALGENWSFHRLKEGHTHHEGYRVLAREIPHKGGQTFGFRIEAGGATFAYLSDHAPLNLGPGTDGQGERHEAALALAGGADVLVHDAQFVASEFPGVAFLGHASLEYACGLAEEAGVGTLVLFHHSPSRTDDEITALVGAIPPSPVEVIAAREGMVIDL